MNQTKRGLGARLLIASASVAALTVALSGCSTAGADKERVLVVQQLADWAPFMKVMVPAFEKAHPGVTVKLQTVDPATRATTNLQVVAGANPPDIAFVGWNSEGYFNLIKEKKILGLKDVWSAADLEHRLDPSVSGTLTSSTNGVPYALPYNTGYYNIVFYNESLFKKAGITPPSNHRVATTVDLFDFAQKLRAANVEPLAVGGSGGFQFGWMVDGLVKTAVTPKALTNYSTSFLPSVAVTASYTDRDFLSTVSTVKSWADGGLFQKGYLTQDYATAQALYQQGLAGMFLGGSFSLDALEKYDFKSDFFLLPTVDGRKANINSYANDAMGIPSAAKQPGLAKEWLELGASDAVQSAIVESGAGLPIVSTVKAADLKVPSLFKAVLDDANANGAPLGWSLVVPSAVGQPYLDANIQKMLAGELNADDVGKLQQAALVKYRTDHKG